MAENESLQNSGRSLAADLLAIRRDRGIDVKEVLDATRLAEDVIDSLESTGLIDNPVFNRVYLRSMYAAYGDVLGLQRVEVMEALEEAMQGRYQGRLGQLYLQSTSTASDLQEIETDTPSDSVSEEASEDPAGTATADAPEKELQTEPAAKTDSEPETKPDAESVGVTEEAPSEAPTRPKPVATSEPESDETGFSMSSRWSALPERSQTVLLPNMNGFVLLAIVAIVLIGLIGYAATLIFGGEDEVPVPVPADTTEAVSAPRIDPISLPDTFTVRVLVVDDILDPVRVRIDDDLTRPYWVDRFDTLAFADVLPNPIREGVIGYQIGDRILAVDFQVTDSIMLDRNVDSAVILVDSWLIPMTWVDPTESLRLSRERLQAWLDSLAARQERPPIADSTFLTRDIDPISGSSQ